MYRDCTKEVTEYEQIKPKIIEDKIELNYRDYKIMKIDNYCSVGMIGKEYAFEIFIGILSNIKRRI